MGCRFSYRRLKEDKICIMHDDVIYTITDAVRGTDTSIHKYYLPAHNIGFHLYEKLLYVYLCSENNYMSLKNAKKIIISKKLYNNIVEIYRLLEQKKIKAVYIINELKKINNYDSFRILI